jgi:hypothetical protein
LWGGSGNKIQGNYLGTNAAGTAKVGAATTADVFVSQGSKANIIGVDGDSVADALERNVIVGSTQIGVWLNGSGTDNNVVAGNYIGTNSARASGLGNNWGMLVGAGAQNNRIGSNNDGKSDALEGNVITGSTYVGLQIADAGTAGTTLSQNLIYNNAGMEIDLGTNNAVDANDTLDTDTGPNGLMNSPVVRSVSTTATSITAAGVLSAAASASYRIEFFAASAIDNTGNGGAERYLGFVNATTNASGQATFSKQFNVTLGFGWIVTATATDSAGNTSEFSPGAWQGLNLDATFSLSSNPSASKTIYLDFDGQQITGTQWNTDNNLSVINVPAYSIDANAAFSDQELFNIQRIFYAVAEDYRPFNVNVTTQLPPIDDLQNTGGGDTRWGIRAAIGGTNASVLGSGSAGGLAYLNSFTWSTDTPALVFSQSLNNGDPQSVATATSHEVGHSFGLNHDGISGSEYYAGHGTGVTSWGPIMGNPYGKTLTQWSKGEYTGATNTGEDDLAIIASASNGAGFRTDDYGNTRATASDLQINVGKVQQSGIIETTPDVDVFRFTAVAGKVNLTVYPDTFDPNLDPMAQLFDANGNLIVTANPAGPLPAQINQNVAAGTYYLVVSGVGYGTPKAATPTGYTDYGSLGAYTIVGSVQTSVSPAVAVGGAVGYVRNSATWVQIAPTATVSDPDSNDFNGGSLQIQFTSGANAGNRLTFGGATITNSQVTFGGQVIGTLTSDGGGLNALSIKFNGNATVAVVQSLLRSVRFRTVSSASSAQRIATITVSDGDSGVSNPVTKTINVTG